MKYSDDHRLPRHRLPLAILALLVGAFLAPTFAHADIPTVEEEIALERSCADWQKVRRCIRGDGEIGLECASKSPFAHFLSLFHSRKEDDEVHVEVVRKAPDGTTERKASAESHETSAGAGAANATTTARHSERKVDERTETRVVEGSRDRSAEHRRVVRADSDLPRCSDGI